MNAYAGRILHVDLASGQSRVETLDEHVARLYLGGLGLGVHLLMEHSKLGRDAFDSTNPLIFCVGPLSGTLGFAGGGYTVVSKSPLTGCVGEGQIQSFFGSELKHAGYDAIIVKGKAVNLSYLWIDDDKIQLCDAQHLRGKSVGEVEQILCNELGDFCIRVTGIGEAGERLCRFATINDKSCIVERTGLGAVMGSKNLKAIAVRGTHDVNIADLASFTSFVKNTCEHVKNLENINDLSLKSTSLSELRSLSILATQNWSNADFENCEKLDTEYLGDRCVNRTIGCATCGVDCNRVAVISNGHFKGVMAQLDFDALLSLGPLCGVDRFDAIVNAVNLANRYGMDCLSIGATVAFAMDLYGQGILTSEQTDGIDLQFGNAEALLILVNKIGKRDGWLGNVLAEGVTRAAQTIGGKAANYACHVKGLELPGYDLRLSNNAGLDFSVTFSGDRHLRNSTKLQSFKDNLTHNKLEMSGQLLAEENYRCNVLDSLIVCKSLSKVYTWKDLVDYCLFATGIQITEEELKQVGERIENLARLYNIIEGKGTRQYDDLPYKIKNNPKPIKGSKKSVYISDDELQLGLDNYYDACGWTADGIPTVERLKQIGLGALSYISENAIATARAQEEN